MADVSIFPPLEIDEHEDTQYEIQEETLHDLIGVITIHRQDLPARLQLHDSELIITSTLFDHAGHCTEDVLNISLISIVDTKLVPHPSCMNFGPEVDVEAPDMPSVLLITYLNDLFDDSSVKTVCFNGIREELVETKEKIDLTRGILQRRVSFTTPSLNPCILPPNRANSVRSLPQRVETVKPIFSLINGPSNILRSPEINSIRLAMPRIHRMAPWTRLFSLLVDGVSLRTLLIAAEQKEPLILLISIDGGEKIGAFLPQGLPEVRGYSGTAATFVFRASPTVEVFPASRKNSNYVATSREAIQIGGMDGKAAIFITQNLRNGLSDACETFDSPQLTTKNQFKILDVEVWHVKFRTSCG